MAKYLDVVIVLAACFSATQSLAQSDVTISGSANGGYSYAETRGSSADGWGGDGAALLTFEGTGINWQIGGGYAHATASHVSVNAWDANTSLFWRGRDGSFGVTYGYGKLNAEVSFDGLSASGHGDGNSYGAFGEWYASNIFTLRWKGGGYSSGGLDGGFAGGSAVVYPIPDLSLQGTYEWIGVSSVDASLFDVGAEYLFSRQIPVSLAASFNHENAVGVNVNGFTVMFNFRFPVSGDGSLLNLDRSGPTQWDGLIIPKMP